MSAGRVRRVLAFRISSIFFLSSCALQNLKCFAGANILVPSILAHLHNMGKTRSLSLWQADRGRSCTLMERLESLCRTSPIRRKVEMARNGRSYSFELCQAVKKVLTNQTHFPFLSQRGEQALGKRGRNIIGWLIQPFYEPRFLLGTGSGGHSWLVKRINISGNSSRMPVNFDRQTDNFSLRFQTAVSVEVFAETLRTLTISPTSETEATNVENCGDLKFSECLPPTTLRGVLHHRQDANRVVRRSWHSH